MIKASNIRKLMRKYYFLAPFLVVGIGMLSGCAMKGPLVLPDSKKDNGLKKQEIRRHEWFNVPGGSK